MKVLIICPNEIFYEPRMRKIAVYLSNKGHEVHVLTARTIQKPENLYDEITALYPNIHFHINDISRTTLKSNIKWVFSSILNLIALKSWSLFKLEILKGKGILNKSLSLSKYPSVNFDLITTSLIDTLPLLFDIKQKTSPKAKILFDSQEFFTGQYKLLDQDKSKWVARVERHLLPKVDIIFATTNVMLNALKNKYALTQQLYRVRNVPLRSELASNIPQDNLYQPIRLIWHGKTINIGNIRGVHIIIEGVLKASCYCELYLQGAISDEDLLKIDHLKSSISSRNLIKVLPSANPTKIVESISQYDIGIIGELPKELNQEYTSSNKLFDFVGAGLAIIIPQVSGLLETIDEYKNGLTYTPGNVDELTQQIVKLHEDRQLLKHLKQNSIAARAQDCYWENELAQIENYIN